MLSATLRSIVAAILPVALLLCTVVGLAQAAETAGFVFLIPPGFEHWPKTIEDDLGRNSVDFLATYHERKRANVDYRFVVGKSIKQVKDWHYVLQFKKPSLTRHGIAETPALMVPYSLFYRDAEDDKPLELAKGSVLAVDVRKAPRSTEINHAIRLALSPQIAIGKPSPDWSGSEFWFPVKSIAGEDDDETAELMLRNRLPVTITAELQLKKNIVREVSDDYLTLLAEELEPGAEQTLRLRPKDYARVRPQWFKAWTITLIDPRLAAKEAAE
jgi:hypothetical protein